MGGLAGFAAVSFNRRYYRYFGGYVVGVYKLGFNPANYITATFQDLQIIGIVSGLVKAAVFGFIISMMGCYHGYKSKGGAQGVGNATTNAVVSSSILILISTILLRKCSFPDKRRLIWQKK